MVELRKITKDNYEECLNLKPSDEQKGFVSPNVKSLAEAWVFYETAYPFAIYADDVMVGFVMMSYYSEKNVYGIWRFMIDAKYQQKGYGKAALQLSIKYLVKTFNTNEVFLAIAPNNTIAENFYSSVGFKRTNEVLGNDIVMRLKIGL